MSVGYIPVVCIVGPTASGKTKLAVNLASKLGGEIISADSMQIYKEFEVSTAKPCKGETDAVPHHLIDFLSVSEEFSAFRFKAMAQNCIKDIYMRKKIPFLVGGTGLYIDSLLKNIDFELSPKETSTEKNQFLQNLSNEELAGTLKKIDPASAKKIHLNDTKRLKRAIDFFYAHGYPISEQTENSKKSLSPYCICKIGLNFKNRRILYEKIENRVDEMFEKGIEKEAEKLSQMKLSKTAKAAIGYKEIIPFLQGECSLGEASENLKKATRNYAKRQLTWFRRDKEINWIYIDEHKDFPEVIGAAQDIVENFIKKFKGKV